jgi:transcription initiation factor TFIID subunit 5
MIYHGHSSTVWQVKFAPIGSYFASSGADSVANVWVLKNTQPVRILAGKGGHLSDVEAIEFHPNAHYIATGSNDRKVVLWSLDTGNPVRRF